MTSGLRDPSDASVRQRLSLRPDALDWVDAEGEIVVLDSDRSVYLTLNETGAMLWRMLSQATTERELVAGLIETFGIAAEDAGRDVEEFLKRLDALGLLARPHDRGGRTRKA